MPGHEAGKGKANEIGPVPEGWIADRVPTPDEMTCACARCGESLTGIGVAHRCESRKQLRERAERTERELERWKRRPSLQAAHESNGILSAQIGELEDEVDKHVRVRREVAEKIRIEADRLDGMPFAEHSVNTLRSWAARLGESE